MSLGDAAPVPDDGVDGGGSEDLARSVAELEQVERELAGVEHALTRIDSGTYGRCDVCGEPMADEVLAADPTARVCEGHLPVLGTTDTTPASGAIATARRRPPFPLATPLGRSLDDSRSGAAS